MIRTPDSPHPPSPDRPLVGLLLAAALTAGCAAEPPGPPPSIVFLTADSLRADHTSLLGYPRPTTPNLERLAQDAVVYSAAQAQATWTMPSYASTFTSRFTSDLARLSRLEGRIRPEADDLPYENPLGIPEAAPTLVTRLVESGYGYAAVGLARNANLAPDWNFHRGFERYSARAGWMADKIARRALDVLDELSARPGPFLLFVHFQQTHYPFRSSWKTRQEWSEEGDLDLPQNFLKQLIATKGALVGRPAHAARFADEEQRRLLRRTVVNRYDAAIHEVDAAVGRLLDALRERGLYDEALIVFHADHGEELGDHGAWGHGHTLYEELTHVPLVIKYPARLKIAPSVVDRPVSNLDVTPTVLAVAGVEESAPPWQGRDLRPSRRLRRDHPYPISERGPNRTRRRPGEVSIRGPRHKLILTLDEGRPAEERFFDLEADPGEQSPLPADSAEAERLRRRLLEWLEEHRGGIEEIEPPADSAAPSVSEETLRELRALGYLDN